VDTVFPFRWIENRRRKWAWLMATWSIPPYFTEIRPADIKIWVIFRSHAFRPGNPVCPRKIVLRNTSTAMLWAKQPISLPPALKYSNPTSTCNRFSKHQMNQRNPEPPNHSSRDRDWKFLRSKAYPGSIRGESFHSRRLWNQGQATWNMYEVYGGFDTR